LLTHFNRDINVTASASQEAGFDTKINWYLHLEKNGNPVVHKKFVYKLYFWETMVKMMILKM